MEDHSPEALERAKSLRSSLSMPEILLWNLLRGQPSGVKFRRQHPIGNVIVDFYCARMKLAVEIDGHAHNTGDRPERDVRRDAWLNSKGIRVVRVPAADVMRDPEQVAASLVALCGVVPPPSGLRPATSPKGGGAS